MNINLEVTTARPEDNALSIQHGRPLSRTNTGSPRMSISPLDNSSLHWKLTMLNMLLLIATWISK